MWLESQGTVTLAGWSPWNPVFNESMYESNIETNGEVFPPKRHPGIFEWYQKKRWEIDGPMKFDRSGDLSGGPVSDR